MGQSNSVICMYFVPIFNSLHCTVYCTELQSVLTKSLLFSILLDLVVNKRLLVKIG